MMWNPDEHSDEENLQWCGLRAMEWGGWPAFLSQGVGPIALVFVSWGQLALAVLAVNILWAVFVRYRITNVSAAYVGAFTAALPWLTCPTSAIYLWLHGRRGQAALALVWPPVAWLLAMIPPAKIGVIQKQFMAQLGYVPTSSPD